MDFAGDQLLRDVVVPLCRKEAAGFHPDIDIVDACIRRALALAEEALQSTDNQAVISPYEQAAHVGVFLAKIMAKMVARPGSAHEAIERFLSTHVGVGVKIMHLELRDGSGVVVAQTDPSW